MKSRDCLVHIDELPKLKLKKGQTKRKWLNKQIALIHLKRLFMGRLISDATAGFLGYCILNMIRNGRIFWHFVVFGSLMVNTGFYQTLFDLGLTF